MTATKPVRALRSAHRRELGVTLEMLVGFVEQVSVDLGASRYIATQSDAVASRPIEATTLAGLLCVDRGTQIKSALSATKEAS